MTVVTMQGTHDGRRRGYADNAQKPYLFLLGVPCCYVDSDIGRCGRILVSTHLWHSNASPRLLSHSSLPHRCLSQTGESPTGRSNAALIGPHAALRGPTPDNVAHLWLWMSLSHRGRHNCHERSANVGISLLTLAIRAYRRELTSTSVRLFLGLTRNIITHATAIHRGASGANGSFAPVVRAPLLM